MLRVTMMSSSDRAKKYYTAEYFLGKGLELPGVWGGLGADRLGLQGTVTRESFHALCDNLDPNTGESLTLRTNSARTVGWDFNVNCPKSVSVVALVGGDSRVLTAFSESMAETMALIEAGVATRVRRGGQDTTRATGNLIRADFVHLTTRPEDGQPDPHLHGHSFVFNATHDPAEDAWKAAHLRASIEDTPYYKSMFHHIMASKLRALGYKIRRTDKEYEIEGVPTELLQAFSRRTRKINRMAEELGITDPEQKARLGATTRQAKRYAGDMDQLKALWLQRPEVLPHLVALQSTIARAMSPPLIAEPVPIDSLTTSDALGTRTHPLVPSRIAGRAASMDGPVPVAVSSSTEPSAAEERAVQLAVLHGFERASVVPSSTLLAHALHFGIESPVDPANLRRLLDAHPELVRRDGPVAHTPDATRPMATSRTVLAEERWLVDWVRSGMATRRQLAPRYEIDNPRLDPDQRAAVQYLLNSVDTVMYLHGKAGVGKSTTLVEAIQAFRDRRVPVVAVAPISEAARVNLRKSGIADANTVDYLLASKAMQEAARGGVIIVDEAGLLSTPQMVKIARLAESLSARVVLTGDPDQHRSVQRGDALTTLVDHAGLKSFTLDTVRRQSGIYKQAVEAIAAHRLEEGVELLQSLGSVHEPHTEDLFAEVARCYLQSRQSGRSPLIVAPTHRECARVTEELRPMLATAGIIGVERPVSVLVPLDSSEAYRMHRPMYEPGMVLEWRRPAPGVRIGDRTPVVAANERGVWIRDRNGSQRKLDLDRYAPRFDLFVPDTIGLAVGDRIRITRTAKSIEGRVLNNAELHTVSGFTPEGGIQLEGEKERTLRPDFAHFRHGYSMTSFTAQSKSVDHVIVSMSSESLPGINREGTYVATSRGVNRLDLFTDNLDAVIEQSKVSSRRMAALDLVEYRPPVSRQLGTHDHTLPPLPTPKPLHEEHDRRTPRLVVGM